MRGYGNIYKEEPGDLEIFWKHYPYFNPDILNNGQDRYRYQFIYLSELSKNGIEEPELNELVNQYLNAKFNPVFSYKTLEQNLSKFSAIAQESSEILDNILKRADFPKEFEMLFKESRMVAESNNLKDMLNLFNLQEDIKIKYEILRKMGLSILLNRVRNTPIFQKSLKHNYSINMLFHKQLNLKQQRQIHGDRIEIFFWLNNENNLVCMSSEKEALSMHGADSKERLKSGKEVYDLQKEVMYPQKTKAGNIVLKYISRVKNKHSDKEDYTSVIEKIVRKNIPYPVEITDIHGVTFVVNDERDTYSLLAEIEDFLGGTNTRKNEKVIEKAWSPGIVQSKNGSFKIWKTVYDITIPHEMLEAVNYGVLYTEKDIVFLKDAITSLTTLNVLQGKTHIFESFEKQLTEKEKERTKLIRLKELYAKKPFDIYLEMQIQGLKSYLLSKCHGSETEHRLHKHRQVMSSSFYKLFPRKIYEPLLQENNN